MTGLRRGRAVEVMYPPTRRTVSSDSNHTVCFNTMPDTGTEKERLENDLKAYFLVLCLVIQLRLTLCDPMDCSPPASSVHGDSPGKNTGELPRPPPGDLPTQGSNPRLSRFRWILYRLSHQGSPRILEQVAYPFSRASSWPRNWTRSPALRVDSLPAELPRKPLLKPRIQSPSHPNFLRQGSTVVKVSSGHAVPPLPWGLTSWVS